MHAKARIEFARKYEGASKSRRTSGWRAPSTSANSEIDMDLATLRNRSRELRRNDPWANKAIRVITNNVVGCGIRTQIQATSERKARAFMDAWKSWAHTTACDYEGLKNFMAIQNMVMDAVVESGEVLIRKRVVSGQQIPIQLQVLESDFLDLNRQNFSTDRNNDVIQGIEYDNRGKIVAYHIYNQHPGAFNVINGKAAYKTERIPADDILHIYLAERPGQGRGVPWCHSVMINLKDLNEYQDTQLMRQKIAACFSVFIHDLESNPDLTDEDEIELASKVEPGLMEVLPPGKDIKFANPPGVENYSEYVNAHIRAIAAGYGLSFEALSGDLSQVNFSSARMGWLDMHRNIQTWQKQLIIPQLIEPVFAWFLNASRLGGLNPTGVTAKHLPPKREMIDPTKEVPALIDAIRSGVTSFNDAILETGRDPDEHLEQLKSDKDKIDSLGLILDSDASATQKNGARNNLPTVQEV